MSNFSAYSSAPDAHQPFKQVDGQSGYSPDICGAISESPSMLKVYLEISTAFRNSAFTPQEQQIILMTVCHEIGSDYSNFCKSEETESRQLLALISRSIKDDKPIEIEKLQALRKFTSEIVTQQGWVDQKMVNEFLAAGYSNSSILDIQAGISLATLSHYTRQIAYITRKLTKRGQPCTGKAPCALVG